MRAPALPVRRTLGALCALVTALTLTAGCAAGGADSSGAATGQRTSPVSTGNTLDQKLPAVAAHTRLVDQDGHTFTLRSLRGKVVVLAPLLTMCQETCPMTTANIHRAAQDAARSSAAGRVVYLELTVDPDRDTVHRMHAYAKLYGALPDWRLATGKPAQVKAVWKSLGVITQKAPVHGPVRDWLTGKQLEHSYDVHHQDVVMAISAAGRLRWITVGHPDARGTRLPTTLRSYLNDEGRTNYAHPNAGGADSWTTHDVEQAVAWIRGLETSG
ncbi:MAG: SCO family protein [Nocardioidaceae bacterium]